MTVLICNHCQQPVGDEVAKYGGEPVHPGCIPLPESLQDLEEGDPVA